MKKTYKRGNILVLVAVIMLIVFTYVSVAMNASHGQMLATSAYAGNFNGYRMVEGGLRYAEKLLNEILSANLHAASEAAYERIEIMNRSGILFEENGAVYLKIPETGVPADLSAVFAGQRGKGNVLFKTLINKFADEAICEFLVTADSVAIYKYTVAINDGRDTEYDVTVNIEYANGGFDITATAMNAQTGARDAAIGRAEFIFDPGTETVTSGGGLYIQNVDSFRYELVAVKKAFE